MADSLERDLRAAVGAAHVLADEGSRAPYETDWTGRFHGSARFVVRPADTAEVAAVVRVCARAEAAIVPQGGNTGLVGGGVPRGGEVGVSLARLAAVEQVDELAGQVVAGAGATLESLQRRLAGTRFRFGVDHAARSGATLGGMVATNAGGERAMRYGSMRSQLIGLEAVLADGGVVSRMSGLVKDNAGYDLPALLAGSEGTLGLITCVRLRLVVEPRFRVAALFGLGSCADAVSLVRRLREDVGSLEAAELFFADGLELVMHQRGLPAPFASDHPAYLLVECAAARDPAGELAAVADGAPEPRDVAVADDTARRAALWAYREAQSDAVNAAGTPHKLDVSVPLDRLCELERRVRELAGNARAILFGHVGDGNLHVNLLGASDDLDEAVLGVVAELGGSISAEHGVGVAKRRWLSLTRSPEEIAAMRAIKRALDPGGILNPGVLL